MKKTYKNPTLLVVKIQPSHIMQTSNVKLGGSYDGVKTIEARGSRFSDDVWEDE